MEQFTREVWQGRASRVSTSMVRWGMTTMDLPEACALDIQEPAISKLIPDMERQDENAVESLPKTLLKRLASLDFQPPPESYGIND